MRIESIVRNHPGTHRAVGIPRLTHQHGGASTLPVSDADVVHNCVARNHIGRPIPRYVPAAFTDDYR